MANATPDERAAALQLLARELKLTTRQRLLAETVVANPDMAIVEAAKAATLGGTTDNALSTQAAQILALPKVQAYQWALMLQAKSHALAHTAGSVCTTAEILQRMSRRARTDIGFFLEFTDAGAAKEGEERDPDKRLKESFVIDLQGAIREGYGVCVEGLSFDKFGRPSLKLTNGRMADEILGRWLGLDRMTQEEPAEIKLAREVMAKLLANPELARAMETIAFAVEREKITLQLGKGTP